MTAIRKTFLGTECDQDWDKLPVTERGRHCGLCNKPVIDITHWDRKTIRAYYKQHPKTCSMFYPEQVVPSLTPVSDLFKRPRIFMAGLLSFFGIHTAFSQQKQLPPVRIEQTSDTSSLRNTLNENLLLAAEEAEEEMVDEGQRLWRGYMPMKRKKKLYISTRFPFIHKRSPYRTGGCPSF